MMAVTVTDHEDLIVGRTRLLFKGLFHYTGVPSRTYDVAADGRFVMVAEPELEYAARQVNIVLNWSAQLLPRRR